MLSGSTQARAVCTLDALDLAYNIPAPLDRTMTVQASERLMEVTL